MKKLLSLVSVAALLCAAIPAKAQFVAAAPWGSAITNNGTTPYTFAGLVKSNMPITAVRVVPVGVGGVQLFINIGTTNALSITNAQLVFELVGPRRTNGLASPTMTWNIPVLPGTTGPGLYTTNFSSAFVAAQANTALAQATGLRLMSLTNYNAESIFVTNLDWSTR